LSRLFAAAYFAPLQADLRGLRLLHVLCGLLLTHRKVNFVFVACPAKRFNAAQRWYEI